MPLRLVVLLFLLVVPSPARGDDWPQWLGPRRDGVWREQGTPDALPKGAGLPVRWRVPVAGGYAGPAVAAGRVFVTDFKPADPKQPKSGVERVHCLDEKTGRPLWTHEYAVEYSIDYPAGPRPRPPSTATACTRWAPRATCCASTSPRANRSGRSTSPTTGLPTPIWGHAAHPLIDGDKLICLTGPAPGGKLVTAFDKRTGKTLWTALKGNEIGYCPPTMIESAGTRQLIIFHPESVNALDPETGEVRWSHPFGPVQYGVSITTPRHVKHPTLGELLLISSYWDGTLALKLPATPGEKPTVLWHRAGRGRTQAGSLHSLMAPPLVTPTHLYGMNRGGELRCLDLATGDVLWETYAATTGDAGHLDNATAFLVPNPGPEKTFLFNESGEMILARLSPQGYEEVGRTKLLQPTNTAEQRPCCGATRRWRTAGCTGGTTGRSCASDVKAE